jgi:hypothetical protein
MMSSCVHLSLGDFQDIQNPDFLQKVTKETKSHNHRPGPSFPSLPSVKSVGMGLVAARQRQASAVLEPSPKTSGARAEAPS